MKRFVALCSIACVFLLGTCPLASAAPATPTPAANAKRKVPADQNIDLTPSLKLVYYYITGHKNGVQIRGEVKNTSRVPIDGPTIFFTLYDKDGNVVGGDRASTSFLVIPPHKMMPFVTTVSDVSIDEVKSEDARLCVDYGNGDVFANDPRFSNTGLRIEKPTVVVQGVGQFQLTGVVRNKTDEPIQNAFVHAFIYKRDGRFAGDISTAVGVVIPPGKTARFKLDQGVDQYSSDEPLWDAGYDYTYELRVGRDSNIRFSAC